MAVYQISPTLYQKLHIVTPIEKENKHVSFSDLNPIRTFRYTEAPSRVSGQTEELLRQQIKRLKRRIRELETDRNTSQMAQIQPARNSYPISSSVSELSVTSPHRPEASDWARREVQLAAPPRNIQAAQIAQPVPAQPRPVLQRREIPPTPPRVEEPPLSAKKRILLALGVICVLGILPSFAGVVFLGPVGFAITGGLVALGIGFFKVAGKIN